MMNQDKRRFSAEPVRCRGAGVARSRHRLSKDRSFEFFEKRENSRSSWQADGLFQAHIETRPRDLRAPPAEQDPSHCVPADSSPRRAIRTPRLC
jgi:hypothetical protein